MKQRVAMISLVVNEYDEAIEFYTRKLDFIVLEDTRLSDTKRWVVISPKGDGGCKLLLAKASDERQHSRIGNQTGGRVFLFMHTNNFDQYFQMLVSNDVTIVRWPAVESFGKVAVFEDLYGNLWDLIQPAKEN